MFQIHIRKSERSKTEIDKFVLFNGKVIENKGKDTDFKWLKSHLAHRVLVMEENTPKYEATFFYAEFDGEKIVVELGEIQPYQFIEERKIV